MKTLYYLTGTMALIVALNAQTNLVSTNSDAGSAVVSNAVPDSVTSTNATRQTDIFADRLDVDTRTRKAIYTGNVRVIDPRIKLTCDRVTAQIGEGTNNYRHIVAEGNVVIDAVDDQGKAMKSTSTIAIYSYQVTSSATNETVELSGTPFPRVEWDGHTMVGKSFLYDRRAGKLVALETTQHLTGLENLAGTNNPVVRTSSTNKNR